MKFGGNKYDTQLTSTRKRNKYFMHDMHKLAVDVKFTHMKAKNGIKNHGEIAAADMYK